MTENKTEKLEREYVIPLRNKWKRVPRYKRANKAVKAIKEFLARHMRVINRDLNNVKIDKYLNEEVWFKGIKNPPARIKVKAVKDETGVVRAELFDIPEKLKFKKAREEKREAKAIEKTEKAKPKEEKKEEKPEEKAEEEKKEEAKEKKSAVVEEGQKLEKAEAKKTKHQAKQSKQPKHQFRKALQK